MNKVVVFAAMFSCIVQRAIGPLAHTTPALGALEVCCMIYDSRPTMDTAHANTDAASCSLQGVSQT